MHKGLALLAFAFFAASSWAQSFPAKPVRLVIPFAPGGSVDAMGRIVAQKLSETWGQPVVVENRPGAGTNIAAEAVAKSPADGYTVLLAGNETLAINQHLFKKLAYDPARDFALVRGVFTGAHVLLVHPSVPAKTLQELVAYLKANPDKHAYGSSGNGATTHLNMEHFKSLAGVSIQHVPYKGAAPAMTDLLGGRVQFMLINIAVAGPHLRAGKLNAVGIASARRSSVLPNLPTFAEAGYKDFESNAWFALVAPAGTPRAVVDRIGADTAAVLALPEVKDQKMAEQGLEPYPLTPEQLAAQVKLESERFSRLIKQAGVTVD